MEAGYALVFTLLLMMGMAVLSAGMLAVAEQEARIAGSAVAYTRARARAEGAVRRELAGWSTRREAGLATGHASARSHADGTEVEVRKLDGTTFLLSARAFGEGPAGARASAAVMVRVLDADSLAGQVGRAAVSTGLLEARGGRISGVDACDPSSVAPWAEADSVVGSGAILSGLPRVAAPEPFPALPFASMADRRHSGGAGTPRPRTANGTCSPNAWNWGAVDAAHPCADPVLVHSRGDLVVRGGQGAGVLFVDGDLTLTGGFVFRGSILATGRIMMDDVEIRGSVRGSRVELRSGMLQLDSCVLRSAFSARAFDGAFRPAGRWWVPFF